MTPSGFKPGQTEFFWDGPVGFMLHEGEFIPLTEMPQETKVVIDTRMNPKHHRALDEMGIEGRDSRRIKFLKCNCSSFDFTPDVKDGVVQLEYVACPERGSCRQEGILCQPLEINGKRITMAELRVISQIREGKYDKEICDDLNIAPQTLRAHKQSIERKLNADRKVQVALKAVEYGIS